jgi:ribosomal protein S18 acetylase RimI-like enzyme
MELRPDSNESEATIIPAFGHLNADTPELAISILPSFRGYGIGTKLMKKLFNVLLDSGYKRISLSVQKDNLAVRFYEKLGYCVTEEKLDLVGHDDYIMVKQVGRQPK